MRPANASLSLFAALTGAMLTLLAASSSSADERVERLPEHHRSWLEHDVTYIILERERELFLSLETMEEREHFIEAFWRNRDPNPSTPENEFKDEHYRRLEYVDEFFGRGQSRDGWQTDQGRYYIILGPPRDIERFEGYEELVATHLWFYQGDQAMGSNLFFYLVFFRENDMGDFKLYSPLINGPQALFNGDRFSGQRQSNGPAVRALREISPELAAASLSFDAADSPDYATGQPSLGSDIMLTRIADYPQKAIRADYIDAWLAYGDRVSSEYSFNYVPSRNVFALLADPSGTALVQYSVEIDSADFALGTDDERTKFFATLDITVEARTRDGLLVSASDKEASFELSPSQMRGLGKGAFVYQDDFVLVPGVYDVSVIVKNRILNRYTVAQTEVHVPRFSTDEPRLTDVITGFATEIKEGADDGAIVRAFQVGRVHVQPAAENLFIASDTAHLMTQAFGATSEHRVAFELRRGTETRKRLESEVGAHGLVHEQLPLDSLEGGYYDLVATLRSPDGEILDEKVTSLTLSPRTSVNRPVFVFRRGLDTRIPGLLSYLRGQQLGRYGRVDESTAELEAAVAAGNPRLVAAKWELANAYLRASRPDDALALLSPLQASHPNQYEVVAGLGLAAYLKGDHAGAVTLLERARTLRPPDTRILNALGESHYQLGDEEGAREAFERSLNLDPDQPAVTERLDSLRQPKR